MLILDAALPPGAPWWVAALAALTASPGVAAIVVAWLQSRVKKETPDLKAITDRIVAAEEKLAAIAGTDSKALTVVKEDLDALAQDVAKLRASFSEKNIEDSKRRERAGRYAENEKKELRKEIAAISDRLSHIAGRIDGMMTERNHG